MQAPPPTAKRASSSGGLRLAIVVSHPIQYVAPWFAHIAATRVIEPLVFYLWDFGVTMRHDREFGLELRWDVPLLTGYRSELVANNSREPGTHRFGGLNNPSLIPRVAAWSPDAILLFGYKYQSHLRLLLSSRLGHIPIIFRGDSHDIGRRPGPRNFGSRLARRVIFRRFNACLAVGRANTHYLRSSGVADDKIFFAPHAVDNERFRSTATAATNDALAWKKDLGIDASRPVILFAGKLDLKKRPLDLLHAFRIAITGSSWPIQPALLFVGSGDLGNQLHAVAGADINKNIFFAPFQNQSRMPMIYAAGDLFVLPSSSETWGLAVNEAMNAGLPAIVSSHVGCGPDLVIEGETGWVFKAGNVHALSDTITHALSDRARLRVMGAAARDRVALYSYEAATNGLLAALHRVTGRSV
jgi:glycosyltransferase involved in cell wall biosynthesis